MFDAAIAFVLDQEGGYVDDPIDPGGATNFGVTYQTLQAAQFKGIVPAHVTPRTLSRAQAIDIYKALYWAPLRSDELPPSVAFAAFDCAVNQGTNAAAHLLQQTLGVPDDGIVGEDTLTAAKAQVGSRLLDEFNAKRLLRYFRTPNADRFGYGWIRRSVGAHRRALAILWGLAARENA